MAGRRTFRILTTSHHTKFSGHGSLVPGVCAPLSRHMIWQLFVAVRIVRSGQFWAIIWPFSAGLCSSYKLLLTSNQISTRWRSDSFQPKHGCSCTTYTATCIYVNRDWFVQDRNGTPFTNPSPRIYSNSNELRLKSKFLRTTRADPGEHTPGVELPRSICLQLQVSSCRLFVSIATSLVISRHYAQHLVLLSAVC